MFSRLGPPVNFKVALGADFGSELGKENNNFGAQIQHFWYKSYNITYFCNVSGSRRGDDFGRFGAEIRAYLEYFFHYIHDHILESSFIDF